MEIKGQPLSGGAHPCATVLDVVVKPCQNNYQGALKGTNEIILVCESVSWLSAKARAKKVMHVMISQGLSLKSFWWRCSDA